MENIIKSTTEKLKNDIITIDEANKILLDLFVVSNMVCPKCGEDDYWEQKSCTCQQCGHIW